MFRNIDRHITEKNHNNINAETHASKMCKTNLLSRDLDVPNTIKVKREAVKNNILSIKTKVMSSTAFQFSL